MGKRVRISNDSLNSYGTRVLTAGMDVEQYMRNPVLLYMHERGSVIGYVKDIRMENDEVTGELVFDEVTELSKRCKRQFEFGSLKMVSAGLDIIEMSEDSEYLVVGQTSPTIVKSKLFEVSVVDIGANDDALVLKKDGNQKKLALQLGLPETATEAEITAKLGELHAAQEENVRLKKEKDELTLASITTLVDTAISEKRISADKREEFVNLGKEIGAEKLSSIFSAMSPHVKLSTVLGHQGTGKVEDPGKYAKLSEVPADKLLELRKEQPDEYRRLYRAEYGMECEI